MVAVAAIDPQQLVLADKIAKRDGASGVRQLLLHDQGRLAVSSRRLSHHDGVALLGDQTLRSVSDNHVHLICGPDEALATYLEEALSSL